MSRRTTNRRMVAVGKAGAGFATIIALTVAPTIPAMGHGYIGGPDSTVISRAALTANTGRGDVAYEPQSIEGPKGFPAAGPTDGRLASAGIGRFQELDAQSPTRWEKNVVSPGSIDLAWKYTATHATSKWHYYVTKPGWDQNAPLSRDMFELVEVVDGRGSHPDTKNPIHRVTIPSDRTGYHVVLAVWDIADTANAFYQVVDLEVAPGASVEESRPSAPQSLHATGVTAYTASIGWKAPPTGSADHFDVLRDGKKIGRTNGLSFTDTGLKARQKVTYSVVAVGSTGLESERSNTVTVKTRSAGSDAKGPGAPSQLHTMSVSSSAIDLMWSAPSGGSRVVNYNVERAIGDGGFSTVGMTDTTTLTDSSVAPSTRYRYRVVALDKAGTASPPSDPITVTTEALPTVDPEVGGEDAGSVGATSWDSRSAYRRGDIVMHNGIRYECIQDYQGHGDPQWIIAPSLWVRRG